MNKALNLTEEQSEDGWRPVMGRFWVAEACVVCRAAPRAKHRAMQSASEMPVGMVSLLGEFLEPEP